MNPCGARKAGAKRGYLESPEIGFVLLAGKHGAYIVFEHTCAALM